MRAWSMLLVLFFSGLAGCAGTTTDPTVEEESAEDSFLDHLARASFDTTGVNSLPLEEGPFSVLDVERVPFPSHDGTQLTAALWRPDVPEGTEVPVILMISPYFSTGLFNVDSRTGEFFHRFVEHGYAFAKVAVRGTSHSDGCMESFSLKEQQDMDDIVTYFGQAEWSNGNVGIIGVSYVGSTPWAAATHENDHLKTIVPISGVTDWFQLGFRNGSREPRTPIHMPLYWGNYGVPDKVLNAAAGGDPTAIPAQLCEEFAWGVAASEYSVLTGDQGSGRIAQYWADRDVRERVAKNYNGSIYLIHGLQDWNVNADMAVPFVTDLQAAGVEVKWLLGQWGHTWPDNNHDHRRWDFAEQLLRWFDVHLKGHDLDTGAVAEVEDSSGLWRIEDTWPPADANWTRWYLGDGSLGPEPGAGGSAFLVNPGGLADPEECTDGRVETVPGTEARFRTAPMEEDLRFAGMPRVHVTVAPSDARGGHIYAELLSEAPGGGLQRLIHGTMNLRFHEGGEEPQTIVPGQEIVARMELFPMDAVVPEGHRLVLRLVPDASIEPCAAVSGEDVIQRPKIPGPDPLPLRVFWGEGSVVELPVIQREVEGSYPGQPS